jgi:hypothetical protein
MNARPEGKTKFLSIPPARSLPIREEFAPQRFKTRLYSRLNPRALVLSAQNSSEKWKPNHLDRN